MTPQIKFGTDGWRGVMADDFTYQTVRYAAQGVAEYMLSRRREPVAVIGAGMPYFRGGYPMQAPGVGGNAEMFTYQCRTFLDQVTGASLRGLPTRSVAWIPGLPRSAWCGL